MKNDKFSQDLSPKKQKIEAKAYGSASITGTK